MESYVILFLLMYSMIAINDFIKLFTFKIIIEFYVYDTFFFFNCTDLVEITFHKRDTALLLVILRG